MTLSLKLLGEFAVRDADGAALSLPTRKTRALLGYLAANADKPQPRERLMALLWSSFGEKQARHNLNQALLSIRKLGDGVALLDGDAQRVTLRGDAMDIDLARFHASLDNDPAAAAKLYKGPFLDGLAIPDPGFEDWLAATRSELHELACNALERAADAVAGDGDTGGAIEFARRLVALDPLREDGHRRLMRLLHDGGDRAGALRQYQACADILNKELQVEPDATTRALYEEIRSDTSTSAATGSLGPAPEPTRAEAPPPLPDKPSIAVLPFANLSGDPEQDFFGEGLAEDIITELSRFRSLFVIARNSTFAYKGRTIDVKTAARDLGVRYVLEGSVRKSERRIRVTGQLIDAETGNHIWAERYDRELDDLFAIQDEITDALVAAIEPEVGAAERERALRQAPESLDAWGLYQKCLAAYYGSTEEGFRIAIDHFERASAIDPSFALAFAMAAESRCRFIANWSPKETDSLLAEAAEKAQRAIALDPRESMCLAADARVRAFQSQFDLAIAKALQAVTLNPNHALSHHIRGFVLVAAHQPQEALESFDQAIRLSPNSVFMAGFQMVRAVALYQLERYDEAVEWARQSVHAANPRAIGFAILAASLSELDRMDEAEAALQQLYDRQPNFRIGGVSERQSRVMGKRFTEALRKAGVPE
jgi:TolB-like protein